jgi:putative transposase
MPWRQVDVMTQRLQFIRDARRRLVTFTELCALYGVSRFTGYKWLHRAEQRGWISCRSSRDARTAVRTRPMPS